MIIREASPVIFFHYTKSQHVAGLRFCVEEMGGLRRPKSR
jgi:hypothetical protein